MSSMTLNPTAAFILDCTRFSMPVSAAAMIMPEIRISNRLRSCCGNAWSMSCCISIGVMTPSMDVMSTSAATIIS